jgi:hypothetical protein
MKKILLLTAFMLLALGCGNTAEVKNAAVNAPAANANAAKSPVASEPAKEVTFTAGVNPRDDVISAAQKLQKLPFWSARITSETTPEANAEMQYLAPNRYRIKKTDGEVIVIGGDSYSNEEGKWEKLDENIGETITTQTRAGIEEGIKNLKEVQIVGKEKVGGKDATVYTHKIGDVTTKIWIGSESGLQLKNEVEATIAGKPEKQTTVYDYETKVIIEAPKID